MKVIGTHVTEIQLFDTWYEVRDFQIEEARFEHKDLEETAIQLGDRWFVALLESGDVMTGPLYWVTAIRTN